MCASHCFIVANFATAEHHEDRTMIKSKLPPKRCQACGVARVVLKSLDCGHLFCPDCIAPALAAGHLHHCLLPSCSRPIQVKEASELPDRFFGLLDCLSCQKTKRTDRIRWCVECRGYVCVPCVEKDAHFLLQHTTHPFHALHGIKAVYAQIHAMEMSLPNAIDDFLDALRDELFATFCASLPVTGTSLRIEFGLKDGDEKTSFGGLESSQATHMAAKLLGMMNVSVGEEEENEAEPDVPFLSHPKEAARRLVAMKWEPKQMESSQTQTNPPEVTESWTQVLKPCTDSQMQTKIHKVSRIVTDSQQNAVLHSVDRQTQTKQAEGILTKPEKVARKGVESGTQTAVETSDSNAGRALKRPVNFTITIPPEPVAKRGRRESAGVQWSPAWRYVIPGDASYLDAVSGAVCALRTMATHQDLPCAFPTPSGVCTSRCGVTAGSVGVDILGHVWTHERLQLQWICILCGDQVRTHFENHAWHANHAGKNWQAAKIGSVLVQCFPDYLRPQTQYASWRDSKSDHTVQL